MKTTSGTSRRRFMASATALTASATIRTQSSAAQFEFKCGSIQPVEHPTSVRLRQMWQAVERESGGRVKCQFFPSSMLGSEGSMLSQVRLNAIQFQLLNPGALSAIVPVADISHMGFAFRNVEEGMRVMNGPLGAYVRQQTEAKGMYALRSIWPSGMRQIGSNTRMVRTPDDLRGFKVKVTGTDAVDMFKTLGAIPVQFPYAELYTALQTHLVDGEDVPILAIANGGLNEVNKYVSMLNQGWGGYWILTNPTAWKSLPADLQEIIERNNAKASAAVQRDTAVSDATLIDRLKRQGLAFNRTDQTPFRALLGTYFKTWASEFGTTAWGLLTSSLGHSMT